MFNQNNSIPAGAAAPGGSSIPTSATASYPGATYATYAPECPCPHTHTHTHTQLDHLGAPGNIRAELARYGVQLPEEEEE